MKFVLVLVALIVIVGGFYGLAKFHVIPLQSLAKSSPAIGKVLVRLSLLPAPKPKTADIVLTASAPAIDPLAVQKAQIAAEQAQIDQEKAALAKKTATVPIVQTAPQLLEIYEAMSSDDLATLFTKQPDSVVVSTLIGMDTKKAAKAIAAMPPDRAAKITALMNQAMAMAQQNPPQPAS